MKIKYRINDIHRFKVGDKVRVKNDCEWEWKELRNKEFIVTRVIHDQDWRRSKFKQKRPGLEIGKVGDQSDVATWDSFGFELV